MNDNWIPLQNKHEITFSNLSPGKYILRVKGSNNDGVWNEKGNSIKIIITPPFWKTWWFMTISSILFIWVLIAFYRKKIKNIEIKLKGEQKIEQFFSKNRISQREEEIITLLLQKKNRKEIEDLLYISSHTVKNHVYNIYKKLQVRKRGELIYLIESFKKLNLIGFYF